MSAVYFVARSSVYVGCIVHIVAHTFACRSLTFWRACDIVRSRLRVQKRSTSTTSQNCARRARERECFSVVCAIRARLRLFKVTLHAVDISVLNTANRATRSFHASRVIETSLVRRFSCCKPIYATFCGAVNCRAFIEKSNA